AAMAQTQYRGDLALQTGWRVDELDWNIAGFLTSDDFVNVLSELQWED
ncbi:MAG: hypothetical protein GWN87_01055, partial [Desulfuromonadales bacterium]|nr:hypothetical protein [Desulfuromonadales bacterium]